MADFPFNGVEPLGYVTSLRKYEFTVHIYVIVPANTFRTDILMEIDVLLEGTRTTVLFSFLYHRYVT